MIHLTCLAHAFHRIAETIRSKFTKVDELISSVKKIFLKAPSRIEIFKNMYSDLSLPPQPIVTRWGTWLNAANYYCQNFQQIKNVVAELDATTSMYIEKAEILLENNDLKNELINISVNYYFLVDVITKLETRDLTLVESLSVVEEAVKRLEKVQGPIGDIVNAKVKNVLQKNSGLAKMKAIKSILTGISSEASLDVELSPSDIVNMQYCPITSVEVERSFNGLINDDFIVEIKCPFGIKDTKTFLEAINSKKLFFCRLSENGKIELKVDHSYYYQVQEQMQISKRNFCYFVVYSVNWMEIQTISFDDSFWREKIFYTECLLPELVNPQYGKTLLVDDILDPQHILENIKAKKAKTKKLK
ncbi:hypothetical protein QTP88_015174 [Uroleucon formosanum]